MARRAQSEVDEQDELHVEYADAGDEIDAVVEASTARAPRTPPTVRESTSDVAILMWCAMASLAGGLFLALGPKLSWKLTQITEGAAYLGIHGGTLIIGGMVIAGLALLRRGQITAQGTSEHQAEDRQLIEQLATDGLQLTHAVEQLCRTMDSMGSQVADLRGEIDRKLRDLVTAIKTEMPKLAPAPAVAPAAAGQQDALFMLASSLDKVGERIEQRLKHQFDTLQDHFEDIGASILSARHSMDAMLGGEPRPASAEAAPWPSDEGRGPTARPTIALPESGRALPARPTIALPETGRAQAARPSIALPDTNRPSPPRITSAQSSAIGFAPNPNGPNGSAMGKVIESPLGVLDLMDDEHMYDAPDVRLESVGAALPADYDAPPAGHTHEDQWSDEIQLDAPEAPVASQKQMLETQTKLMQLSALLSDERLRAALDKMRPPR